jgi:Mn2+/Fe2+ NRAMP family transporter
MLMTSNRSIMGNKVNTTALNILGWTTVLAIFAASIGLAVTWFL